MDHQDKLFKNLQNDILDEYNNNKISKKEMINILTWVNKVNKIRKNNPNSIMLVLEPEELKELEE